MDSKSMHQAYKAHYQANEGNELWRVAPNTAILFGADEFSIDKDAKKVVFKSLGGKAFPAEAAVFEANFEPSWLGLIESAGAYKIVFAQCDPFSQSARGVLPHAGGVVKAMPMAAMTSAFTKAGVEDVSNVAVSPSLNRAQRRELDRATKSTRK